METMLDLLHVLLQQHHVVHVFFAGHMDSQVPRHVGLIVTNLLRARQEKIVLKHLTSLDGYHHQSTVLLQFKSKFILIIN